MTAFTGDRTHASTLLAVKDTVENALTGANREHFRQYLMGILAGRLSKLDGGPEAFVESVALAKQMTSDRILQRGGAA